jgi:hypothetical protein
MLFSILLGLVIWLSLPGTILRPTASSAHSAPLQAGVEVSQYLPPEMYGQWSVRATLIESNQPDLFSKVVNDIWNLERVDEVVIVSNPVTGASAAINVDSVKGNTATFHRWVNVSPKKRFVETPTVTVKGDRLSGVTVDQIQLISQGKLVQSYYGTYLLEATRVSGARVQFGEKDPNAPVEFEIEEIKDASN